MCPTACFGIEYRDFQGKDPKRKEVPSDEDKRSLRNQDLGFRFRV